MMIVSGRRESSALFLSLLSKTSVSLPNQAWWLGLRTHEAWPQLWPKDKARVSGYLLPTRTSRISRRLATASVRPRLACLLSTTLAVVRLTDAFRRGGTVRGDPR